MRTMTNLILISAASLAIAAPVFGQDSSPSSAAKPAHATATGQKQKVQGIIVSHDADRFTMRDMSGVEITVVVNSSTKLEEKKGNPFRSAKKYSANQLVRGLNLEVEGRGDGSSLVADKIKIDPDALVVAMTVETRVTPVEGRVSQTETRITQAEQNAQRLSGQIEELNAVANAANGGAKKAQRRLICHRRAKTNERISSPWSVLMITRPPKPSP